MKKNNINLIIGTILFLLGSILWFVSLFLDSIEIILFYDKIAAGFFIVGSIFFLIDLL